MPTGGAFVINEKLLSMKGDLWIADSAGNNAYQVDGQFLSLRGAHVLKDLNGQPLYEINKSLAHVHKTFEIKQNDRVVATIQEALLHFMGDRFKIELAAGGELQVSGNWINRQFNVTSCGRTVIEASRQFFSIRNAYGVQIAPDFDTAFALAIVVALERMELEERHGSSSPLGTLGSGGFGL